MAINIDRRKVVTTRHEWVIPSPATATDVGKAFTFAQNSFINHGGDQVYDDTILIEAGDEEVIVYWIERKEEQT